MNRGMTVLALVGLLAGCSFLRTNDTMPYTVNVSGEVEEQGCYVASEGMKLRDVLKTAGVRLLPSSVRIVRGGKVVQETA